MSVTKTPKKPWPWPASTIVRVIDGDSFEARLTKDLGFNGTITFVQKLRLNRINTTPAKTEGGKAATAYVQGIAGYPVDITTLKPYKYGDEWMAEVTTANGVNLSDALVEAGHAVYWDGTGPRPGG